MKQAQTDDNYTIQQSILHLKLVNGWLEGVRRDNSLSLPAYEILRLAANLIDCASNLLGLAAAMDAARKPYHGG